MKISPQTYKEVAEAFEKYETEVSKSNLEPQTKQTYLLHSKNFVRWLANEFEPGIRKK